MKPRVRQVIVVEGRYDKNTLSQVVDAVIVETGGFSVFHDREKLAYLRRLAAARGVILMTDPDGAGFVIRNHLKGVLPPEQILQAYVPDVYGKERRKRKGGKEGKLGVEGMPPAVLLEALRRCGATWEGEAAPAAPWRLYTTVSSPYGPVRSSLSPFESRSSGCRGCCIMEILRSWMGPCCRRWISSAAAARVRICPWPEPEPGWPESAPASSWNRSAS